jgi:hypothetical protein
LEVNMFRPPLIALASLTLVACQMTIQPVAAPGVAGQPPYVMGALKLSPSPVATATPRLFGLLDPGASRLFRAEAATNHIVLVGNPSTHDALFHLVIDPAGPVPSPSPSPSAPPNPDGPTPDLTNTAPEVQPPPIDPFPSASTGTNDGGFGGFPGLAGFNRTTPTRRSLAVGGTIAFWINNGDATLGGDSQRPATARVTTEHATFYVDTEAATVVSDATLARLADAFEHQIRPRMTPVFGEPSLPKNQPIDVVFSPWIGQAAGRKGMMGYFWPRDVLGPGGNATDLRQHANSRHVLFLSTALLTQPDVTVFGTLAHEYQHLLMFDAKSRRDGQPHTEETWLDEGFAMLAMDLAGYGLPGGDPFVADEVDAFRHAPTSYSLTDWSHNPHGYSYGLSYLFCRYLVDRFGVGIVHEVQSTPGAGTVGLGEVFAKRGLSFSEVFMDWARTTWRSPAGMTAAHPSTHGDFSLRPWGLAPLELDGLPDSARTLSIQNDTRPLVVLDAQGGTP